MKGFFWITLLAMTMDSLVAREAATGGEHVSLHGRQVGIPEFAVFGDQTVKFDVDVEAPLGSKASLLYDLAQFAGGIVAPLETSRPVGGPLDFAKTTRQVALAEVPLPRVVRKTQMLLCFSAAVAPDASRSIVGKVLLQVYPKAEPGQLARKLAMAEEQAGLHLGIFGPSPALRKFFQEQKMDFKDLGSQAPSHWEKEVLPLGEITSAALEERHWGEGAVFFVSDATGLPGVYRTISPTGSVTKVTVRFLDNLDVDPQSQELLVDTIQQALKPTTSTADIP